MRRSREQKRQALFLVERTYEQADRAGANVPARSKSGNFGVRYRITNLYKPAVFHRILQIGDVRRRKARLLYQTAAQPGVGKPPVNPAHQNLLGFLRPAMRVGRLKVPPVPPVSQSPRAPQGHGHEVIEQFVFLGDDQQVGKVRKPPGVLPA